MNICMNAGTLVFMHAGTIYMNATVNVFEMIEHLLRFQNLRR